MVDAGPFRTTTTCTDLLPRYYGYVCIPCRRFCCAVHVTCTVARTHARTNVQTSLAPVSCPAGHESRVQTSRWREACRSPVSQLRCMCCAVAVRVLLSILSVPTSGLPVPCLPVCLPACPPGRLAAWPEPAIKIIISRLPGTLYDTMLLPADPPHAGLSTWRPRYGLYGRSDSNGRQPSRDAHTRQCHPCPLLPPPPGPPSHDSQLRAEPLIPCVLV